MTTSEPPTERYSYRPATPGELAAAFSCPLADGHSYLGEIVGGTPEEAERQACRLVEILNGSVEHPWTDAGPTLAEAGGPAILARSETSGLLHLLTAAHGSWFDEHDWKVPHKDSWTPTGWRRMPKAGTASE